MTSKVTFIWKEENSDDSILVESFIDAVSSGIEKSIPGEDNKIEVAQSDRLIDFSILVLLEKKLGELKGDSTLNKLEKLECAHEGVENSRIFLEPENEVKLELFYDEKGKDLSIFSYLHFYKPTEDSNKKREILKVEAEKVGKAFLKGLSFLKD